MSNRRGLISRFLPILLIAAGVGCLVYAGVFHTIPAELTSPESEESEWPVGEGAEWLEGAQEETSENEGAVSSESDGPKWPEDTEAESPESTETEWPDSGGTESVETVWPEATLDATELFDPDTLGSKEEGLARDVDEPTLIRHVTRGEVALDASGTIKLTPAENPDQLCPT